MSADPSETRSTKSSDLFKDLTLHAFSLGYFTGVNFGACSSEDSRASRPHGMSKGAWLATSRLGTRKLAMLTWEIAKTEATIATAQKEKQFLPLPLS